MKPISILQNLKLQKPKHQLRESVMSEKPVYMNTWRNYNQYGADLVLYNNIDGWMTIEDALQFCQDHAEDEPFINDTDDVPFEISEYDNAVDKLEQLQKIEDADVDEDVLTAFLEQGSIKDIDDIISTIESGDYIFLSGVDNDYDLATAYIDMCGGISEAVPRDRLDNYIDYDKVRESYEAESGEEIDDATLEDIISNSLDDESFVDNYFDYDAYGRDLGFDFTYTSTGALDVL